VKSGFAQVHVVEIGPGQVHAAELGGRKVGILSQMLAALDCRFHVMLSFLDGMLIDSIHWQSHWHSDRTAKDVSI